MGECLVFTGNQRAAHINESGEVQSIQNHLQGTAKKASGFADRFECGEFASMCGWLHDIGKYSDEFQRRIRDPEHVKKVDHSTAGAKEAVKINNFPVAMIVAAHHAGLLDGGRQRTSKPKDGTFWGRILSQIPEYDIWREEIVIKDASLPEFCRKGMNPAFTMSFFIRMIYSCLVDADYLDTEEFMNKGKIYRGKYDSTEQLVDSFSKFISKWFEPQNCVEKNQKKIFFCRNQILLSCIENGKKLGKGIYTLTVPTGGGKTTASLGFALHHMKEKQMDRIIYVIPYTSVIDQNAHVFSKILGKQNVLEHHSGVLYELSEDSVAQEISYQKVLATENWDSPVIVTTAVQFFESLFASKSSKCRKLHNIANSVIIFDEAQTLPVPYLEPCIAAIAQLVDNYQSTAVFCTATQPALEGILQKYVADKPIMELCDDAKAIYQQFKRTIIKNAGIMSIEELRERLREQEQVLCIVNKRKIAQSLYESLSHEGTYCLTTLLCPVHRKEKFMEIKERLKQGLPCRVVATSLIEAGVDLDFPSVYRQEAGLDSLLQSAGRCNREGRRAAEDSSVVLFQLENESTNFLTQNIAALRETVRRYEDIASLDAISFYFQFYRELVGSENLDQKEIMKAFEKGIDGSMFPFAKVSERFHLIENDTKTIYIPTGEGQQLIEQLQSEGPTKELFRRLGQYSVNVYPNHYQMLVEAGCLEAIDNTVYILRDMNQYNMDTGLKMDVETGVGIYI